MPKTILLVEDLAPVRQSYKKQLLLRQYQVIEAATAEEARKAVRKRHVDLMVIDVRLVNSNDANDVSGLLLALEDEFKQVLRIISTVNDDQETSITSRSLGPDGEPLAHAFVNKETGFTGLLAAIESVFKQQAILLEARQRESDLSEKEEEDEALGKTLRQAYKQDAWDTRVFVLARIFLMIAGGCVLLISAAVAAFFDKGLNLVMLGSAVVGFIGGLFPANFYLKLKERRDNSLERLTKWEEARRLSAELPEPKEEVVANAK